MILRKISKFDATRCQILRLKCTKFDGPDPAVGACGAVFNGTYFFEEGEGRGERRGGSTPTAKYFGLEPAVS